MKAITLPFAAAVIAGGPKLAAANEQIESLTSDLAAANQTIADQSAQIAGLELNLAAANATIVDLDALIGSQAALLDAVSGDLSAYEAFLREEFRDSDFVIAGANQAEKVANLVAALLEINRGRNLDIFRELGGKVGKSKSEKSKDDDKKSSKKQSKKGDDKSSKGGGRR